MPDVSSRSGPPGQAGFSTNLRLCGAVSDYLIFFMALLTSPCADLGYGVSCHDQDASRPGAKGGPNKPCCAVCNIIYLRCSVLQHITTVSSPRITRPLWDGRCSALILNFRPGHKLAGTPGLFHASSVCPLRCHSSLVARRVSLRVYDLLCKSHDANVALPIKQLLWEWCQCRLYLPVLSGC